MCIRRLPENRGQVLLDCHDLTATIASLAEASDVSPGDLERVLLGYDASRFADLSEDPELLMPREVLAALGRVPEDIQFTGAYYFHGTRSARPESFRERGVLPLAAMVEEIWSMLHGLIEAELSRQQWQQFRKAIERGSGGHDGWLYRCKTDPSDSVAAVNQGPFAMLVREFFFRPDDTSSHDYLGCPEIVQDIARCCLSLHGIDLEARFREATVPCVVRIRSDFVPARAARAALWYAFSMLRDGEISRNARWGYDFEHRPVLPGDVVDVEVLAGGT